MRRRLLWALAVSSVLLVAVTLRASTTKTDQYGQNMSPSDRAAVTDRAVSLAAQVMSYNAATAEPDIAAAKRQMTDRMQAEYDRTLPPAADRREQATAHVRVQARVARVDGGNVRAACPRAACAVAITSLTKDRATVLLFVNQYATADTTKNTVVNPTWEVVRLERRGGRWIIAAMEAP